MLIVDTVHVLPPSVVAKPEEFASLRPIVVPYVASAVFRMIVVARYSITCVSFLFQCLEVGRNLRCDTTVPLQAESWHSTAVPQPVA